MVHWYIGIRHGGHIIKPADNEGAGRAVERQLAVGPAVRAATPRHEGSFMSTSETTDQPELSSRLAAFGPNEWLVDEIYQQYLTDKSSVDPAWWDFFADYVPTEHAGADLVAASAAARAATKAQESANKAHRIHGNHAIRLTIPRDEAPPGPPNRRFCTRARNSPLTEGAGTTSFSRVSTIIVLRRLCLVGLSQAVSQSMFR